MNKEDSEFPDSYLEPENILQLYAMGAFPMAESKLSDKVNWYLPDTRTIIRFPHFNIPRSLKKIVQAEDYEIRFSYDQERVINLCAEREETWISSRLIRAYRNLIDLGFLHSVEVYRNNVLAGGLYGVAIEGAFFGESMFTLIPQSSKIALVKLMERLRDRGYVLLDVQYMTDHLAMFGPVQIPMDEFKILLKKAYTKNVSFL
jgi:leucyl/phenylalanyl-tRNA---protein transferase